MVVILVHVQVQEVVASAPHPPANPTRKMCPRPSGRRHRSQRRTTRELLECGDIATILRVHTASHREMAHHARRGNGKAVAVVEAPSRTRRCTHCRLDVRVGSRRSLGRCNSADVGVETFYPALLRSVRHVTPSTCAAPSTAASFESVVATVALAKPRLAVSDLQSKRVRVGEAR